MDDMETLPNPYRALAATPEDILTPGPEPTLGDRFWANFQDAQRMNTVLGAAKSATSPAQSIKDRAGYDAFPGYQGFLEGTTAFAGQVAGTVATPESFVPIGLGGRLIGMTGRAATGLGARIFAGAVDGATVNAVTDLAVQGIDLGAGVAEHFDAQRYAIGVLLGAGIGGGLGAAAKGVDVLKARKAVLDGNPYATMVDDAPAASAEAAPAETAPAQAAPAEPAAAQIAPVEPASAAAAPRTLNDMAEEFALNWQTQLARAQVDDLSVSQARIDLARSLEEEMRLHVGAPTKDEFSSWPVDVRKAYGEKYGAAYGQLGRLTNLLGRDGVPVSNPEIKAIIAELDAIRLELSQTVDQRALGERLASEAAIARGFEDGAAGKRPAAEPDAAPAMSATPKKATEGVSIPAKVSEVSASPVAEFLNLGRRQGMANAPARDDAGVARAAAGSARAEKSIARVRDTADALAKALNVPATRQGRIRGDRKVLGQYGTATGVVRVRSLEDFDVLTHEYGHHLDASVPAVKTFIKQYSAVLKALDYDPQAGHDYEGFAEFFRLWLTNRAYVAKTFPKLAAEFAKVLETAPQIRDGIEAASNAWGEFLAAPSSAAVQATISTSRRPTLPQRLVKDYRELGVLGTIHEWIEGAYTWLFDDLNPINSMVRHLDDLHHANTGRRLNIKTIDNPYRLARMSRGAYSAGHMDVMHGVSAYRGLNPETPSLRDAIVEAMGKPNGLSKWEDQTALEFGAYLWSRRALGEWTRFEAGDIPNPPDKLTKGDHQVNIAEMEAANPNFKTAAEKVHLWARGLWKKKLDAGLITRELYEQGLQIKDYVPGLRDFSNDTDLKMAGKQQGRGGSMKGGLVKRFRGSKRDVINPLESLMADAYETAMAIARNDVVKQIDRLAKLAGPGSGRFAEPVKASELKAMNIDPLEAVENAAKNAGLAKADIVVLRDAVEGAIGDQKAAIFRPAIINERGEPIVFFRDGGDLRALRLADGRFGKEVYQALTGMGQAQRNWLIDFLAMPARVLRVGITAAPEFIMANLIRDQMMAWVYYGSAFKRLKDTALGGVDDAMGRDTAKIYNRSYGITGGQETASLTGAMVERDLSLLRRKGWKAQRLTSWRGILGITEFSETATRVGLFRTFAEEARKRGLSEIEAAYEASWRARDYIDFDRRGAGIGWVAKIVPFFNVALQGLDKTARQMLKPLAKKMLRLPMTAEDMADLPQAVQSMWRVGAVVSFNLGIYALMSRREGHDEISTYTRSTHTMLKAGEKWVAVPKPYEFAVAMNLAEAGFDAMAQRDPRAAERWLDSVALTLTPPSLIEGNPAISTWFEVRTNTNLFSGGPIVPDAVQGMEPWLQYTARTSRLSRQFGEWFGIRPAVSDHIIGNMTGSLGKGALALYDMAQPDAPTPGWDDAPITRRFIKDASKGSQSISMFWDLAGEAQGKLTGAYKSWRVLTESGDAAGAADYFAGLGAVEKAYVATSALDADARRLHPLNRARSAVLAIGRLRRDMAGGQLRGRDGEFIQVSSAAQAAVDDVLSSLAMASARNALTATGVKGWAQKAEIDEEGFYRELEAASPEVYQALADSYATSKVWRWDAIKESWPELQARALADGSGALTVDLVAVVKAQGFALPGGIAQKRRGRPDLTLD